MAHTASRSAFYACPSTLALPNAPAVDAVAPVPKEAAVTWTSRNAPLALNALDLPLSMRTTPPQRCPPRPPKART